MESLKSSSDLVKKENQGMVFPNIIKSEVNFLVFPFFALSRKGLKSKLETEYRETISRGDKKDEKLEIVWNVSANPKYGYPGPFDRRVHKAIEQIIGEILQKHSRITNPIALGSLYELCKKMGMGKFGGREYKKIKEALQRVTATLVVSEGTFYNKAEKRRINDTFHLYERVVFKDAKLPDGETADTNDVNPKNWTDLLASIIMRKTSRWEEYQVRQKTQFYT